MNAQRCDTAFREEFPETEQFTQKSLFDEGGEGAHDLCGKIRRTMKRGSVITN